MTTIEGLVDHQVVQRDTPTGAVVALAGKTEAPFELRAFEANLRGVTEWMAVDAGAWKLDVTLPVGGPYHFVTRRDGTERSVVSGVLVGDLWLMAGQSNMQGSGRLDQEIETPGVRVGLLDMARTWRLPIEPLHRIMASPDIVHHGTDDPIQRAVLREGEAQWGIGAGLGVAFANALAAETGVPVGLIATAHGGTSMGQWSPDLADQGGASLYGSMLLSLQAAGGRIAGCVWYQGESDAADGPAQVFGSALERLVGVLRTDVGRPDLPFIHVQLGCFTELPGLDGVDDASWSTVREVQRTVDLGAGGVVTAVDLPLGDPIHVSTAGLRRLGRRMARLVAGHRGITIGEPTIVLLRDAAEPFPPFLEIRIPIHGATGPLSPAGQLGGFEIVGADGAVRRIIHASRVEQGEVPVVVLEVCGGILDGDVLWHGRGRTPHCTLVDAVDQAVPAFGPLTLRP